MFNSLLFVMITKKQISITIDRHCFDALKHIVSKGRYKNLSNAVENMIIKEINATHFDNIINKLMSELNKPLFEDKK